MQQRKHHNLKAKEVVAVYVSPIKVFDGDNSTPEEVIKHKRHPSHCRNNKFSYNIGSSNFNVSNSNLIMNIIAIGIDPIN